MDSPQRMSAKTDITYQHSKSKQMVNEYLLLARNEGAVLAGAITGHRQPRGVTAHLHLSLDPALHRLARRLVGDLKKKAE